MAYTCPMHPKIVQNEPGSCPMCGMVLIRDESAHAQTPPPFSAAVFDSVPKASTPTPEVKPEIKPITPQPLPPPIPPPPQKPAPVPPPTPPITKPSSPPKAPEVIVGKTTSVPLVYAEEQPQKSSLLPLIAVLCGILILSITATYFLPYGGASMPKRFIINFMAMFFIVFGGFKLADLKGFARGYASYDLIAQRIAGYGYIYPFIELAFGFSMLFGFMPVWLLWAEIILMSLSGAGVLIKKLSHEDVHCVCLGTLFKIPLTTVTLLEDFGMAFLAFLLLPL